ncbi:MAG TPA: undecaprenyldiphospho-muramoylpentapeptide beta-N-acetylglucosaminyltransferase [Clostridiaceae bacterium]|nr:undecaprenyldiphospho-muramoylpentapeptide beta-N-acetylglucosaminyltransferase [Clostridiaceae bacterium]
MKKIIMTGGGTAGHVNPNLALIPQLKKLNYEISYIGSKDGIEKTIIEKEGLPYFEISSGKLRRYFDLKNFSDPFKVTKGLFEAMRILRRENPSIVFSKGGFVSVPVVMAAKFLKIPVLSHESDMTPGLANRISLRFSDKLLVTFEETLAHVGDKGILVGSPIREELFTGNRGKALEQAGFTGDKPVILVMGGSIGSVKINKSIRGILERLLPQFDIIHLCGKGNIDSDYETLKGYQQYEYLGDEMKDVLAASDLIVSRAGANSIFEFLALRKPNLLIPLSLSASRGDQLMNAESFMAKGFSMILKEEDLTEDTLFMSIEELYKSQDKYVSVMKESRLGSATDRIIELIERYSKA